MTDDQSASLSWNKAPMSGLRPDFHYCRTIAGLLMWCGLSDERTGLSFTMYNTYTTRQTLLISPQAQLLCDKEDVKRVPWPPGLRWRYTCRQHSINSQFEHEGHKSTVFQNAALVHFIYNYISRVIYKNISEQWGSAMWRRVVWYNLTDVFMERTASIFRIKEYAKYAGMFKPCWLKKTKSKTL
jgi:hypothetical protein